MNQLKTDKYSKIMLTIIACCLVFLVLERINIVPQAIASDAKIPAIKNHDYGLVPINEDGSINVRLQGDEILDVRLIAIDRSATWEPIEVIKVFR